MHKEHNSSMLSIVCHLSAWIQYTVWICSVHRTGHIILTGRCSDVCQSFVPSCLFFVVVYTRKESNFVKLGIGYWPAVCVYRSIIHCFKNVCPYKHFHLTYIPLIKQCFQRFGYKSSIWCIVFLYMLHTWGRNGIRHRYRMYHVTDKDGLASVIYYFHSCQTLNVDYVQIYGVVRHLLDLLHISRFR